MLFDAANTHAVANTLQTHYAHATMPPLVCDPVCVSTSGHTLLQPEAIEIMIKEIFPLTTLITPNKSEAELLLSHWNFPCEITDLEGMLLAAKNLTTFGPRAVLLKGGHITVTNEDVQRVSGNNTHICIVEDGLISQNMEILRLDEQYTFSQQLVVDVLHEHDDRTTMFLRSRVNSTSTHGTGCTLSAALACALGRGFDRLYSIPLYPNLTFITSFTVSDAIKSATTYTHLGIENAFPMGKGCGPLNHLHSVTNRIIPP